MKILGIENRTENWRTAYHFSPFFGEGSGRLAKQLLANHWGTQPSAFYVEPGSVHFELFWYGVRDYLDLNRGIQGYVGKALAELYHRIFHDLREDIQRSGLFWSLQPKNYDVSTQDRIDALFNNLSHTEIDIVLESPNHLFIGEAKHESGFNTDGTILVHQLIREYVMARILVEHLGYRKGVVPFVVGMILRL